MTLVACSGDDSPAPSVSVDGPPPAAAQDAGGTFLGFLRGDAGSSLPETEGEIELIYGSGDTYLVTLAAELSALDLHLSVDTTKSIDGEIDELQDSINDVVIRQLSERVPDVSFGVSRFEDFPGAPYGHEGDVTTRADVPFELLTPVTSDVDTVVKAVALLDNPIGSGLDLSESGAEALWQIATGKGYELDSVIIAPKPDEAAVGGGLLGGVGFRQGALHAVLHITDANSHVPGDYGQDFPGTHSLKEAAEALNEIDARMVGIVTHGCDSKDCDPGLSYQLARADLELVAMLTGAVLPEGQPCLTGINESENGLYEGVCPLVYDVDEDGSGLSDTLVDALITLLDGLRFDVVTATVEADPLGFIQSLVAVELDQEDGVAELMPADLLPEDDPDGQDESFLEVTAGTLLGFELTLRNGLIAPTDIEQRFRIRIRIEGDGLELSTVTLAIVIPPG